MLYASKLFILFIIFSFVGWLLEVLYGLFELKRFVNRGFLIGPMCPIYGIGCVLLYLILSGFKESPIVLFIISMFICSALEYFASYILEKIFKTRWWDYNNMKFNINGRICLEMAIPFGLLGLLVVYLLFPFSLNVLAKLSSTLIYVISLALLVLFLLDLVFTCLILKKFKHKGSGDETEEIKAFTKSLLKKKTAKV